MLDSPELVQELDQAWSPHVESNIDTGRYLSLHNAFVARVLTKKEKETTPGVAEAIAEEMRKLTSLKTWDETPQEWADVKRKCPEAILARSFMIVSMKHSESSQLSKVKARFVEDGSRLQGTDGSRPTFDLYSETPATCSSVRLAIAHGSQKGHVVKTMDATSAFPQVALSGRPTYILLPPEARPESWGHMRTPVVQIKQALYGDPRSGHDWSRHVHKEMTSKGFSCVDGWPSMYIKGNVLVVVYVDDFTVSGPIEDVDKTCSLLESMFTMGKSETLDRLLGCKYVVQDVVYEGKAARKVTLDMTEFAKQCVERYDEVLVEIANKLQKRKFHPDDLKYVQELRRLTRVATPWLDLKVSSAPTEGVLGVASASVLMKILWMARVARPELSKVVTHLAADISRWTREHDLCLRRLVSYISTTQADVLVGYIGDKLSACTLTGYTDSDFASCTRTKRSTSGQFTELIGPATRFPLSWSSRKQTSVSQSTPEAELIAAAALLRRELLPLSEALAAITRSQIKVRLMEDNSACLLSIKTGMSKELRHLSRSHGVSVRALHEAVERGDIELFQCPTAIQKADIFTKQIVPALWNGLLDLLGMERASKT
jgi:hypothetical protein